MTYRATYSQQRLQRKSIARLKQIYSEIACTVEVIDKRCKDAWITAIADYQSAHPEQFITPADVSLTPIEISFYDHEYYAGDKLIAAIRYDDDLTRPWVVMVNDKEVHRASTNILCHHYICSHYKDGTLPVQEQNATDTNGSTENEIMCQIFNECQKYGFEIVGDGINGIIYNNEVKLGEVGCTLGGWWVTRAANTERVACQSALQAVWLLAVTQTQLLNRPFEMLTPMDGSSYGSMNQFLN
ncbi:hypothetical protein LC605_23900 [Nostoc sp. CHAB 5836]|uniref:hypothetical protein n=1 Tax=Nostoc sp. CHAB 5836 TaxID=2780404 RepID=UPI001E5101C7|nr:hypothetical protein [Nostoc sp. CHAB 5836]MCC5618072.1 hypothetical protein [Nostoc sp. CHAB 5836]